MIERQDWSTSYYSRGPLRALITLGAQPAGQEIEELYYLTVAKIFDERWDDVLQEPFENLDEALSEISKRYGHWQLSGLGKKAGGGCDSCQAK